MDGFAWDGDLVPLDSATVPLVDRGFLLGDGVFETMRAHGGNVFRRADHMERMARGLRVMGLDEALVHEADAVVGRLVDAPGAPADAYVRVQVSSGTSEQIAGDEQATVTGMIRPFKPYPMRHYQRGLRVVTSSIQKFRDDDLATVKSLSFAPYLVARRRAMDEAAHDAILLNDAGRVAEATTSNVFALLDDTLFSPGPEEGALDGVTRRVVMELAADTGIAVREQLDLATLGKASEIFLTNTTGSCVPVTQWNGSDVGTGEVGELSKRLHHAVEAATRA